MSDLSNIDISIECKEVDKIYPIHAYKMDVTMDSADMTTFIDDNIQDILEYLDNQEMIVYLEGEGYTMEEES